jgi:hypothetical protein
MVFDFNAPISGYDLTRLQTAVAALVGGTRVENHNRKSAIAIRGRWQSADKAWTIGLNA